MMRTNLTNDKVCNQQWSCLIGISSTKMHCIWIIYINLNFDKSNLYDQINLFDISNKIPYLITQNIPNPNIAKTCINIEFEGHF